MNCNYQGIFILLRNYSLKKLRSNGVMRVLMSFDEVKRSAHMVISFNFQPRIMKRLHIHHLSNYLICAYFEAENLPQVALNKLLYAIFIIINNNNSSMKQLNSNFKITNLAKSTYIAMCITNTKQKMTRYIQV